MKNDIPSSYSLIRSGKICTTSGMWEVVGIFTTQIVMQKGDVMPLYCGRVVIWKLLYEC